MCFSPATPCKALLWLHLLNFIPKGEFFGVEGGSKRAKPQKKKVKDVLAWKWWSQYPTGVGPENEVGQFMRSQAPAWMYIMVWASPRGPAGRMMTKKWARLLSERTRSPCHGSATEQCTLGQKKSGSKEKSDGAYNIHNCHSLRPYHVPGTVLGTRDTTVNETGKALLSSSLF